MDRWEQWRKQLARPASRMVFDKSIASTDSPGAWFGQITHGAPDEQWPECNGRAMWPLLQIVVPELPVRPATIDDLAMIRVYIDPEYHAMDTDHGQGWEVRASTTLDGLKPIVEPKHGSKIRPSHVTWEPIDVDYPTWDDLPNDIPEALRDDYHDLGFENHHATKVGGWPSTIQAEICWAPWNKHPYNPEYIFQIDSEDKAPDWLWGDAGTGYFGRGTGQHRGKWAMAWQCC